MSRPETNYRKSIDDIGNIYVRSTTGAVVPMRSLAVPRLVTGPQALTRYNGYRAVIVNGAPKPGVSSGDALNAMERISASTLPPGYSYEWTGTALQEKGGRRRWSYRARARRALRLSLPRGAL